MSLLRQFWYLVRRDRYAAELEEEMRLHREMRAERLRERGMSREEAAAEARRRFGNVTTVTERSRDMWGFASLDQLRQDLRFAARRLRQRPAFSVPVIVVLALGIGATTAVFSAVDAAMLRSLPFARADRLVTLTRVDVPSSFGFPDAAAEGRALHVGDIARMRDVFSHVAAYAAGGMNLSDDERPLRVNAGVVTASFFATLGARPILGRTFSAEEGRPGGPQVAILSHALWERQFGSADVVGRTLRLHGRSYQVVGVMQPGFNFPSESDLWIPMTVPVTMQTFEPFRGWLPHTTLARIAPGVSLEAANARLVAAWKANVPTDTARRSNFSDHLQAIGEQGAAVPLQRKLLGNNRRALLVLLGATGLLLVIACANVANLLLSDAAARRREIAVREVLGAGKRRIVRQLLSESLLLAVAGTLIGVALAPALLKVLRALLPASLAGVAPAQLDLRVLGFAIGLAVVTSVLFGLWPALGVAGGDASSAVKAGGGHGSTGRLGRARQGLVVLELALSVMLLVGAGLMLRSFARLMNEPLGLNPEQVATLEMTLPRAVPQQERARIVGDIVARLRAQPEIGAVGAINDLPLRGGGGIAINIDVPGAPPAAPDDMRFTRNLYADAGYFEAMGIRVLRGRGFLPSDTRHTAAVAVINEAMARAYWPERDPLGQWFTFPGDTARITVVGVIEDVREAGLQSEALPQMFQPIARYAPNNFAIVARGALGPAALMARLTEAVRAAAPGEPAYNVRTMEQVISASVRPRRTNTLLIALFAALAVTLSALGVYAVVAYGVAQRTREFGIRMALGARGSDLVRLVTREMAAVMATGVTLGLLGAWAASRVLGALLYEVDPRDPGTFVAVPLVLMVPVLVATLVPALRARRVNPTQVMKAD